MTLEELNETVDHGDFNELVRVEEAKQVKALSKIADDICARPDVRLVLLAGASSAGKTTTAKRLCTQLRVNGREAMLVSTDDYFVGDARNPRDENGELDYEHVECVDIPCLVQDLNALFAGDDIKERRFDFVNHVPIYGAGCRRVPPGGIVVLEGIHSLNPRLTEGVPEAAKFRLFVEPRPTLDVFGGVMLQAEHARLLRRMVRDNQFRKMSPAVTLGLWPKVRAGELKWIEPFKVNAEAVFDSYLIYEIAVLKPYVQGLLERAKRELGEHPEIVRMLHLMEFVHSASQESIPGDSIIRETIGGSQLEY